MRALNTTLSPEDSDLQWACGLAEHVGNSDIERALVIVVRELRRQTFRMAMIKARHEEGSVTTDGGRVIHASIHGKELNRLLYGEIDGD